MVADIESSPHTVHEDMAIAVSHSANLIVIHVYEAEDGVPKDEIVKIGIPPEAAVQMASALMKHVGQVTSPLIALQKSPTTGRCPVCGRELVLTPKRRLIPTHLPPADGYADGYESDCPGAHRPPA